MPTQTDLDLDKKLHDTALLCEDARRSAHELARLRVPTHHRCLVNSAVRHLDIAAEQLFKVAHLPRETPVPKARQLSMETL